MASAPRLPDGLGKQVFGTAEGLLDAAAANKPGGGDSLTPARNEAQAMEVN